MVFPSLAKHPIEDLQIIRNLPGDILIGPRRQNQTSIFLVLVLQKKQKAHMVRQAAHIYRDATGNLPFHVSHTPQQPSQHGENIQGIALEENEKGLNQRISMDQRAVKVDCQGN